MASSTFTFGSSTETPSGYESIAVVAAAAPVGITPTLLLPTTGPYAGKKATSALITIETDTMRFTINGTVPSTTVGHLAAVGNAYEIKGYAALAALLIHSVTLTMSVKVTVFHAGAVT
jgi:hypothetical protein